MYVERDDLRQIVVISRNEMKKFIRGRRFQIWAILAAAIFSTITFLPYVFNSPYENMAGFLSSHFSLIGLLVIIAAALFAASTYVSEFEERTALILFTRPVKKTTIYIGKFIGCFIIEAVVLIGYYAAMAVAALFLDGAPSVSQYLASFGCLMLYLFAVSAIAALFSTVMKKFGYAAVMTFFTPFMLIPIISGIIYAANGFTDFPWYMLDQASIAVQACIQSIPGLDGFSIVNGICAMMAWGAITMLLSWFVFTRKEM